MIVEAITADARGDMRALLGDIGRAAHLALRESVTATVRAVKDTRLYRDRTGATRASVQSGVSGDDGFVSSGGASTFLENGTAPHTIEARSGVLAFQMNGAMMFRRSVHHPGTQPRPFMTDARNVGQMSADAVLERLVATAISSHAA